jgi:uncharacterized membrane protein
MKPHLPHSTRRFVLTAALLALAFPWAGLLAAETGASAGSTSAAFSWFRFLAPFHMVALHLPIGFLLFVSAIELWTWRKPSAERREVIQLGMLLGVMATALTMALGYLRASDGGYDELTLTRHRGWGIAAGVLIAVAWGLHRAILKDPAPGGLVAFRTLLFTGFICLSVTGHHGGSLTHGTSLLTENAPQVLRGFLGLSPATGGVPAGGPSVGYATVKGALEKKCYVCHGTEKQKGGLRLDDRALALKGGDSGKPGIAPGDPGRSEIVRACLLPANHDDAMPPEGKEPLTSAELAALIHWIQAGAKY